MLSSRTAIAGVDPGALIHARHSNLVRYRKGQVIYESIGPPIMLYLVLEGSVKLSRYSSGGRSTVIDVCQPNEFFGQAVFLSKPVCPERAVAVENTRLMSWTGLEIEEILLSQPQVGMLLIRSLAERVADFSDRIESLCSDNIECRLAKALSELATRMGIQTSGGALRMPALTHEFLAQYIGTSREMVTLHMNRFRRGGYLSYSRRSLSLHRDALLDWLSHPEIKSTMRSKPLPPSRLEASGR